MREDVQEESQVLLAPAAVQQVPNHVKMSSETSDARAPRPALTQEEGHQREPAVRTTFNAGQEEAFDGWQKMVKIQSGVVKDRIAARESTKRFLDNVQTVSELESALMRHVEPFLQHHNDLRSAFEKLQAARIELQGEQLEIFQMHERIAIQSESKLIEHESQVYPSGQRSPAESLRDRLDFSEVTRVSTPSVVSSRNIRADPSPEADTLLIQIGKVDLLRERLESMRIEYTRVLEEKELRELIGQDLDEPSKSFFQNFDTEHAALTLRLKEAEILESELRQAVPGMDVGVSPQVNFEDSPASDSFPDGTQSVTGKDQYVDDDIAHARSIEDPTVRAAAELFFMPVKMEGPVYGNIKMTWDGKQVDKTSYVNAWLLHRVRTVPTEMERLASFARSEGMDIDPDERDQLLLTHWTTEEIERLAKLEKPSIRSQHASMVTNDGHASVLTNDGHDPASKVTNSSQFPVERTQRLLELRSGARITHGGA